MSEEAPCRVRKTKRLSEAGGMFSIKELPLTPWRNFTQPTMLHDPSQPESVRGVEGVRAFISTLGSAFPDMHCTIDNIVADGDKVLQRLTARGTQQGEFQGIPPTGKAVEIWLMVISRIASGKIVEEWQLVDSLSMLQQLGVVPAPGQAN